MDNIAEKRTVSISDMFSLRNVLRYSTLIAFVLVVIFFSLTSPLFLQANNLVNILSQASMLMFVATGLTFIVVIGGVDLSIAAAYGLAGLVSVSMLQSGMNWFAALLGGIFICVLLGLINSFLVVKVRISVWLATLGTLFIGESIEKIFTRGGAPIYLPKMHEAFQFLGRGSVLLIFSKTMGRIDF